MVADRLSNGGNARKCISRKIRGVHRKVMKVLRKNRNRDGATENISNSGPKEDIDLGNIFDLPVEVDNDDCPAALLRSPSLPPRMELPLIKAYSIGTKCRDIKPSFAPIKNSQEDTKSDTTEENLADDSSTEQDIHVHLQVKENENDAKVSGCGEGLTTDLPLWHRFICGSIVLPTENCGENFHCPDINDMQGPVKMELLAFPGMKLENSDSSMAPGSPMVSPNDEDKDDLKVDSLVLRKSSLGQWLGSPFFRQISEATANSLQESELLVESQQANSNTKKETKGSLDPTELAKRQWHKHYLRLSVERLIQEQEQLQKSQSKDETVAVDCNDSCTPQEVIHLMHIPIASQSGSFEMTEEGCITGKKPGENEGSLGASEDEEYFAELQNSVGSQVEVKDFLIISRNEAEAPQEYGGDDEEYNEPLAWKADFCHGEIEDSHFQNSFHNPEISSLEPNQRVATKNAGGEEVKTSVRKPKLLISVDKPSFQGGKHHGNEESPQSGHKIDDVSVGTIVRDLAEFQHLQKPLELAEAKLNPPPPPPPPPPSPPPPLSIRISSTRHQLPFSPPTATQENQPSHFEQDHEDRYHVQEDISVARYAVEEESSIFVDAAYNDVKDLASFSDERQDAALSNAFTIGDGGIRTREGPSGLALVPNNQVFCDEMDVPRLRDANQAGYHALTRQTRKGVFDACDSVNSRVLGTEGDRNCFTNPYRKFGVDTTEDDSIFGDTESKESPVRNIATLSTNLGSLENSPEQKDLTNIQN